MRRPWTDGAVTEERSDFLSPTPNEIVAEGMETPAGLHYQARAETPRGGEFSEC